MIELTEIERKSVEILIKNIRWEISIEDTDVLNYQLHMIDAELVIKALEKSLQ